MEPRETYFLPQEKQLAKDRNTSEVLNDQNTQSSISPSVGSIKSVRKRNPQTSLVLTTCDGHRTTEKSLMCLGLLVSPGWLWPGTAGPGDTWEHVHPWVSI